MKHYPKTYEDLYRHKEELKLTRIEAYTGSTTGFIKQFKELFTDSYKDLFKISLRYLWLEKQISYNGKRRMRRWRNGHVPDQIFGRFMSIEVGKDHGLLTRNKWFHVTSYFIVDYFPDFLDRNPFEEEEHFEYPYKHATLDYFGFVYQCDVRKEMMDWAEEQQMSFHDFKNWVVNYVLSYNDEQGEEIYSIGKSRDSSLFIRNSTWEKYPLDILYESTKEAQANSDERDKV